MIPFERGRLDTVYCLWYNPETKLFETLKQVIKNEEDSERLLKSNTIVDSILYDNGWHFNKNEVDERAKELNERLVDDFNTINLDANYLKVLHCESCGLYWTYPSIMYKYRKKKGDTMYPKVCPKCNYNIREDNNHAL